MSENIQLKRVVLEVIGSCNYTCKMCPQTNPGRGSEWKRKMPLNQFEEILSQIVPKYGHPQINLEGSGEPTLAKDLYKYVELVKKYDCKAYIYTNGANLHGSYMKQLIDSGIDFIRVSVIGYNPIIYYEWMNCHNFSSVLNNVIRMQDYIQQSGSETEVSSYHLITDNRRVDQEIQEYQNNFINRAQTKAYIWKMHNWSGNYATGINSRSGDKRVSCGRPFSPELTVRAGGNSGQTGAVTPCCQTLGPPNESKSVLGHFSEQSFEEIFWGKKYNELRKAHEEKRFDDIEYCKNCDFLYDNPEVLVWTNDKEAKTYHMLGTDFSLRDNIIASC